MILSDEEIINLCESGKWEVTPKDRAIVHATAKKIRERLEGVLTECPDKDNPAQCFYWLNDADWEQLRKELGGVAP